jgi:hypothetical protein
MLNTSSRPNNDVFPERKPTKAKAKAQTKPAVPPKKRKIEEVEAPSKPAPTPPPGTTVTKNGKIQTLASIERRR